MSVHKLTAGSGYDYLTRQVAVLDASEKGHTGLASYYTERGEVPGVWIGSGLAGIEGLSAGDVVTAEQMQALFGSGHHPLAAQRLAELEVARRGLPGGLSVRDQQDVTRLGVPYKVFAGDVSPFRVEVVKRIAAINTDAGLPGDWPVPADERSRVRTEVGREFFTAAYGRPPLDARELAAEIARQSRPRTTAVAGYDLTFSPVKSVSALWALAPPDVAARIERAHQGAVADALRFLEDQALYTRCGANGVRQVDVRGLVGTAFTHRDSRAGDPDLHTHVAIANRVQTLTSPDPGPDADGGGRWLAIDGRVLFKAVVTASETYNTALETRLRDDLGVTFETRAPDALARTGTGTAGSPTGGGGVQCEARKRPVREVVGVDAALLSGWSARRAVIEVRQTELAAQFHTAHGRPPTPVEALQLAQRAALETRDAKHEPRTLAEQRTAWRHQAEQVLGGQPGLQRMLRRALRPAAGASRAVDPSSASWLHAAAGRTLAAVQERRSTWQVWHVRAEAQRQVRGSGASTRVSEQAVDALVVEVLQHRSVSLARAERAVGGRVLLEPRQLRRADGSSVYRVAGADLYTSAAVLAAEQRLVDHAGSRDGRAASAHAVDVALLEATANGTTLNAGQVALVRDMATSGARLQLAIAPAGSGKTTAMSALTAAWSADGGRVIGLAPSAAAAAALREQTGTHTETLAKLVWSLTYLDVLAGTAGAAGTAPVTAGASGLPEWARAIDDTTLVVIDEAGMADTLSLDTAVSFVIARGGSVRLVGDDQQLAAIGAGGVLRDIKARHGAVHLRELLRFQDPAEGAATLALRDGRPEALGFYLDQGRVHAGDLTTMTEQVFAAWQGDRAAGLDAIMLAPTHDLVADLNQRARAHRLASTLTASSDAAPGELALPPVTVRLSDGNLASHGDLLITRTNDRSLRTSATDWVKNGDRWTLEQVHHDGDVTARHTTTGHGVRLPASYVVTATELGYATTVHSAQGVSVDTMHGLATGSQSRQQLYTMLTRGRLTNHVYLEVVGDGDPHSVIRPETVHPLTAVDQLEAILARDDSPTSAATLQREQDDPAVRLGQAAPRYLDALHVAAEDVVGAETVRAIDAEADDVVVGLTESPAWPTLRAHLLLIAAGGDDPVATLRAAAAVRELGDARDPAAILDWRLDDTGLRGAGHGPLPWLPAVPAPLSEHPTWGPYLAARAELVVDLAGQVQGRAHDATDGALRGAHEVPAWLAQGMRTPPCDVVAEVQVWRAAMQVDPGDQRPTGSPQQQKAALTWQRALDHRVAGGRTPALDEWGDSLRTVSPGVLRDPFAAVLAERLAGLSRSGVDARALLADAVGNGPVPDDHAAAAIWWRISRHVAPAVAPAVAAAVAADGDPAHSLLTAWTEHLARALGPDRSQAVRASTWWPALVTVVERGQQRGWSVDALLAAAAPGSTTGPTHGRHRDVDGDVDECLAMVWRASVLTDPAPVEPVDDVPEDAPPHDLWDGVDPSQDPVVITVEPDHIAPGTRGAHGHDVAHVLPGGESATPTSRDTQDRYDPVSADLAVQARLRDLLGAPEPAPADIERMVQRATDLEFAPVSRERAVHVNELALAYYQIRFHGSWAQQYLHDRFAHDLTGDPTVRPGYAPDSWTGLVDHLRRHGVSEEEMLAAGVASTASTGRLIDRFRDRAILPITHAGDVLGFVGRRHPDHGDDEQRGPKYLNTATTVAYVKGDQLYVADPDGLAAGAVPVLVEGPMDAIAVTLATAGSHVGVAPLGTALTEQQATQLAAVTARTGVQPVVATDADLAGRVAAERAYWTLSLQALDPAVAALPAGADPADLYGTTGPEPLVELLAAARPLADLLVEERLAHLPADRALEDALAITAARPSSRWPAAAAGLSQRLDRSRAEVDRQLLVLVRAWNADPRRATDNALHDVRSVRARLQTGTLRAPGGVDADVPRGMTVTSATERRWYAVAVNGDPRLVEQDDWPALARLMQAAHDCGHDVPAATRLLLASAPLGNQPGQELRYRLQEHLDLDAAAPADTSRRRPSALRAGLRMGPRPAPAPQPRR